MILAVAWPLTFYSLQTLLILFSMSLDVTHVKGHTLDLVFPLGLDVTNVCVKDVQVSDHCCVTFNLSFPLYTPPSNLMCHKRFINQDVALKFSNLLEPHVISGCTDADVATQCFNNPCLEILNSVAPMKSVIAASNRAHPWINDDVRKVKRI